MRMIGQTFRMWQAKARQVAAVKVGGFIALALVALSVVTAPVAAAAQDLSDNPRYSAIVVDAQSGEVFYARRADSARYPASLTKIMTLYMAFDALARGQIRPDDQIVMSHRAASQAPVKVYLRAGETIDVDTAMRLVALYSANDLAVALAEKIGGTEERFAALMTIRAQELGMTQTRFINANGLPDARQLSSARDLAILARAVMRDYPQYYAYFNVESMTYRGRTYVNHNPLHSLPGVDGMKTGYTNAAGYNLVASQVKGNHRLIAIMLGGSSKSQRREHVTELMDTGFNIIERREKGEQIAIAQDEFTRAFAAQSQARTAVPYTVLASNDALRADAALRDALEDSEDDMTPDIQRLSARVEAPDIVKALSGQGATNDDDSDAPAKARKTVQVSESKETSVKAPAKTTTKSSTKTKTVKKKNPDAVWGIQVGAFKDKSLATNWVASLQKRFDDALADGTSQVSKSDQGWYRSRFAELTKEQAQAACKSMSAKRLDCMVIKPDA